MTRLVVGTELETTDFVDDTVRLNPAIGEVEKSYPTIVALSRKVGNREQKILLTGDADCISNSEFNRRVNVRTSNYTLITGSFFWLSDNEVPIDVRRPEFPDKGIYIGSVGEKVIKGIYMVIIPLLFMGWEYSSGFVGKGDKLSCDICISYQKVGRNMPVLAVPSFSCM